MTDRDKALFAEWLIRYYPQFLVENDRCDNLFFAYEKLNDQYSVLATRYDELYREWCGEQS